MFDHDGSGQIDSSELEAILERLGRDPAEGTQLHFFKAPEFICLLTADEMLRDVDPDRSGKITFEEFVELMKSRNGLHLNATCMFLTLASEATGEEPDPKVIEFLKILDEYRLRCETEGNYIEAGRAAQQLETLRKQEEKRQERALRSRQLSERQDVQTAHDRQYAEFNAAWDKYMEEYDQMAQVSKNSLQLYID